MLFAAVVIIAPPLTSRFHQVSADFGELRREVKAGFSIICTLLGIHVS
jgi:hypothetical protein